MLCGGHVLLESDPWLAKTLTVSTQRDTRQGPPHWIQTRSMVNNVFAGDYHSVFKGQGMEFAEVREYARGDDVRTTDWNVTARVGRPFVKIFDSGNSPSCCWSTSVRRAASAAPTR